MARASASDRFRIRSTSCRRLSCASISASAPLTVSVADDVPSNVPTARNRSSFMYSDVFFIVVSDLRSISSEEYIPVRNQ
jgi:hypothetical protein